MKKTSDHFQNEFSSSVISLMMLGFFIILAVFSLFCGQFHNAKILPFVGVVFSLPLYWKVRFDSDSATLFCSIFPKKVKYFEIKNVRYFFSKPDVPDAPAHIYFEMKDGKEIKWELTLFTTPTRQKIKNALEMRLNIAKPATPDTQLPAVHTETVQNWVKMVCKTSKAGKIILCIAVLVLMIFFTDSLTRQITWESRLRDWDKVEGVILQNKTRQVKSGRRRKTVSDLLYRYNYNGKVYTGNKIIYGNDSYPSWVKPGAKREILVNPDKPDESAAMFIYRGMPGMILKYFNTAFFGLAALITGIAGCVKFAKSSPEVPEKFLEYYSKNPPPEQLPKYKSTSNGINPIALTRRPKIYHERYIVLPGDSSKTIKSLMILPILFLLPVAAFGLHGVWFFVIFWLLFAAITWIPVCMVFDLQEKKLYRCHFFNPGKLSKAKNVSCSDWKYLMISRYSAGKQGIRLKVSAHSDTGRQTIICHTALNHLSMLLEFLPELAEKLGNLPIVLKAEKK